MITTSITETMHLKIAPFVSNVAHYTNMQLPLKLVAEIHSRDTFPAFPAHAQPVILRIWQEAHVSVAGVPPVRHVFL